MVKLFVLYVITAVFVTFFSNDLYRSTPECVFRGVL